MLAQIKAEEEQKQRDEKEREQRKKENEEKYKKEQEELQKQRLEREKFELEQKLKAKKEFEDQLPKNWKEFIPDELVENLNDDEIDAIMLNQALKLSQQPEKKRESLYVDLEESNDVNYTILERTIEQLSEDEQLALAFQMSFQ